MTATVVQVTNWARPHIGREVHQVARRTRIDTQLRKMGLISGHGRRMKRHKPFVVTPDGKNYLLRDEWNRCLKDGEVMLVMEAPPAGGGGGSKILAIVALIALSVVTAGIAAGAAGAVLGAGFAAGQFGAYALAAAVSVAGSMHIGAALPKAVRA